MGAYKESITCQPIHGPRGIKRDASKLRSIVGIGLLLEVCSTQYTVHHVCMGDYNLLYLSCLFHRPDGTVKGGQSLRSQRMH